MSAYKKAVSNSNRWEAEIVNGNWIAVTLTDSSGKKKKVEIELSIIPPGHRTVRESNGILTTRVYTVRTYGSIELNFLRVVE